MQAVAAALGGQTVGGVAEPGRWELPECEGPAPDRPDQKMAVAGAVVRAGIEAHRPGGRRPGGWP